MPFPTTSTADSSLWSRILFEFNDEQGRQFILGWVLTFASYLVTAQLGVYLYRDIGTFPALIWPPVGIALAAMVLGGYRMWSAIALASFTNGLLIHAPLFLIVGNSFASTLQPYVGAYVLKHFHFDAILGKIKDVFLLICVGLVTTGIMPIFNYGLVVAYNNLFNATREMPSWHTIWIGGALSALTLTPVITRWMIKKMYRRTTIEMLEITTSLTLVIGLSYFVFATYSGAFMNTSYLLLLIAVLFWISFRAGSRFTSMAIFLMTVISLAGVLFGEHAPSTATVGQRLINIEIFDLLLATFFFILVSVEEQRRSAIKRLNQDAQRLSEALAKIRAEDQAKNEFIATLAHELRNPLAPIMSGLELLRIGESNPDRLEVLSSAERQAHIMRRLLDELLDVARIAQNKYTLHKEEVTLQSVLRESVKMVEGFLKERRHTFTISIPKEDVWLNADPVRLTQIFTNILFNAGKYTKPNGSITLTATLEKDTTLITIKDSGIGISEAMLSQIFEPFIQVSNHASVETGLGIGLSITKRLVELHGGTISVESPGLSKGTIFSVRFQTHVKVRSSSPVEQKSAPVISPINILVVDDNRDAAASLRKLLTMRGHVVDVAHTGREAISHMDKKVPGAVFLDIGLPDIDGYEVARTIRTRNHETYIIGLSGYGTSDDKRRAHEASFDQHLTKPAALAEIERALSTLVT